jgi:methylenetetrahydrofolate reductase (NADPH)
MVRATALRTLAPVAGPDMRAASQKAAEIARIARFAGDFSIEATHPDAADIEALRGVLPHGTPVYLTALPGRPTSAHLLTAIRLRRMGFEPVPHLAARSVESVTALDQTLEALAREAGVRRALVVAGDAARPAGPYAGALELIESGTLQRHGFTGVGVAGYPQGHPKLSQDTLDLALRAKIEAAETTGLAVEIVTQFGFDAEATIRWLHRLRAQGIDHPVRLGLAGPAGLTHLLRYAKRCGVAASAQALARNAGLAKHLLGAVTPDGTIRALAADPVAAAPGSAALHFFSFVGLPRTARWAAAVADGRFALNRADGFRVEAPRR